MTTILLIISIAAFAASYWASEKERTCVEQSNGVLKRVSKFSIINWVSAAIGVLMVCLAFFR